METSNTSIDKLIALKIKLEAYEDNIKQKETKRDMLLEQAKQKYGVESLEELKTYRDEMFAQYELAIAEVDTCNSTLEEFFTGV